MKQINGIWLPDGDTHFKAHLAQGPLDNGKGTYQFEKITMALECVPRDRRGVALDIGAHVGLWSRVLVQHFERVIAFEPVPEHIECWEANMKEIANAWLTPVALGENEGNILIEPVADNSGNAHITDQGGIAVAMRTLDSFAVESVDFIKIDVEGYEYFVLKGGEQTIREHKPVMVVEQKPGHAERYRIARLEAVNLLRSWGADILWARSGDYCMGWKA